MVERHINQHINVKISEIKYIFGINDSDIFVTTVILELKLTYVLGNGKKLQMIYGSLFKLTYAHTFFYIMLSF